MLSSFSRKGQVCGGSVFSSYFDWDNPLTVRNIFYMLILTVFLSMFLSSLNEITLYDINYAKFLGLFHCWLDTCFDAFWAIHRTYFHCGVFYLKTYLENSSTSNQFINHPV